MKRKIFRAVIMFALGEVAELYLTGIWRISIVLAMLISVAVFCVIKKKYLVQIAGLVLMFFGGILNVACAEYKQPKVLQNYFEEPAGKNGEKKMLSVELYGVVQDVLKDGDSSNIQFKVLYTGFRENGGDPKGSDERYDVLLYGVEKELCIGEYISISGNLESFAEVTNPGGFDIKRYYMARGIRYVMYDIRDISIGENKSVQVGLAEECLLRLKRYLYGARKLLQSKLYRITDSETAALYSGILLGDKSGLSDALKRKYQAVGIAHILAISGLHISLIGMTLFKILRRIQVPYTIAGVGSIFVIVMYGVMTGFGMATLRATIMLVIVLVGEIFGKSYDLLTGLSTAFLIMLLRCPYRILDGGMILSITAVAGVALGQYVMRFLCREFSEVKRCKKRRRHCYVFISSVVISVAIQVMTAPMLARLFYMFPTYSLIVNWFVVPAMTVAVASGMIGLLLSFVGIRLAGVMILPGRAVLNFYGMLCDMVLRMPFNRINTGKISLVQVVLYYMVVLIFLLLFNEKLRRRLRNMIYKYFHYRVHRKSWHRIMLMIRIGIFGVYLSAAMVIHVLLHRGRVVFLDVGQGDGVVIESALGTKVVIDGGSVSKNAVGEYVMEPALKALGMAHVDYWFISHTDEDHVNGLIYILDQGNLSGIKIDNLVVSKYALWDDRLREITDVAVSENINVIYMESGDSISDGSFLLEAVHPDKNFTAEDKNSASLALSYQSDSYNILFTGDMDTEALEYMFQNSAGVLLSYDVVKLPHHGSKYSICGQLYDCVSGGYAVVSCGYNNSYGHPHSDTLAALEAANVRVLRTDIMGAISFLEK